ncbi:MAG: hypothetical protein KIT69_10635 [Propionibacteriaceae bacterium]|nr:hypothetical protein [Propionibacteriaceae bacterium]
MAAYSCGMSVVWRAVLALVLGTVLSGCTQPWMLEPVSPAPTSSSSDPSQGPVTGEPSPSPSADSPTVDPARDRYPYDGTIGDETCVPASRDLLDELEAVAALGDAVSFTHGALVKANEPWWTVAVATRVDRGNPDVTRKDVAMALWFVTNGPSLADGDAYSTWPLNPDAEDDAADRALTCLSRVPSPPPDPPEDSPASYTGRLAPGATCVAVSSEMLTHLEAVGRVGGAITYSRGQMVQANKKWWTVAVVTEVHPNKLGHTRENVPPVAFFATNAPSKDSGAVYFALDSIEQDTAAAAAKRCLSG